ncbi:hypothetical protein BaRGS_00020518 [Batillaria attramentaria]|uniref:ZU5 domain-containing protein n=1 Tax=Batillaria attramentaria TaxID=370345 RepID=A0ABD0KMQ8_9CAEN
MYDYRSEFSDSSDLDDSEAEDEDSPDRAHGHVFGFERPSLLQDLRNILHEYPDDGQIFKELVQNAEDAGASMVQIFSVAEDEVPEMATRPQGASRPSFCTVFSGPGLCIYNDAMFTEEDWSGIRKLHTSVKAKDPLKVGRFGLGFKSVFHITDHPVIISGDSVMYMDPFKDEATAIYQMPLKALSSKENQTLKSLLVGVLHVLPQHSLTRKRFKGTLFWFPLRQAPSELSGTVYSRERVQQLKQALRSEVSVLPLFLKKIERVEVYSCLGHSPRGTSRDFSVSLTEDCLPSARETRHSFTSAITTQDRTCPKRSVAFASFLEIETDDGDIHTTRDQWMVVNFHHGLDDMSPELRTLCQSNPIRRPYVGVAARLNSQPEVLQGQLFCFLPLPPEKVSPTGLPVHVNGFFELSQNRRQVKWPSSGQGRESDPGDEPAMSDDALLWNQLLVSEVLPLAYVTLIKKLVCLDPREHRTQIPASHASPTTQHPVHGVYPPSLVYGACPNPERINYHWKPLLRPVYGQLASSEVFFASVKGGAWIRLEDSVVASFGKETDETKAAITEVYEACERNLVHLPHYLILGLEKAGFTPKQSDFPAGKYSTARPGDQYEVVCPEHVSDLMRTDDRWRRLSSGDKCKILHYLCRHGEPRLLDELEIIPLVDGTFCKPCKRLDDVVHVCRDSRDLKLLPGLEDRLCFVTQPEGLHDLLLKLARRIGMKPVDDAVFPKLLQQSIRTTFRSRTALLPLQDRWIRLVWHYLQDKSLTEYDHLPLLPCVQEDQLELRPLQGNYICEKLPGFPPASPSLSRALRHLGITVITSLPDFLHHDEVLHTRVQPASHMGLVKCLAKVAKGCSSVHVIADGFNHAASTEERQALVHCLHVECAVEGGQEAHWNESRTLLSLLQLFPAWPDNTRENRKGNTKKQKKGRASDLATTHISVSEEKRMTPEVKSQDLPRTVSFAPRLLDCSENSHRRLAERLGARETSVSDIYREMLTTLCTSTRAAGHIQFPQDEIIQFMSVFIQSPAFDDARLKELAKKIRFVPCSQSKDMRRPDELYDPEDDLLQELFLQEDRFPLDSFFRLDSSVLRNLRQLGLLGRSSILPAHLIETAMSIDRLCHTTKQTSVNRKAALRKSKALWRYLKQNGSQMNQETLEALSEYRCLPCVSAGNDRPQDYPKSVPLCPEPYRELAIARPREMNYFSALHVVGSVRPVAVEEVTLPHTFLAQPCPEDIIAHLQMVISKFSKTETRQFSVILYRIYTQLTSEDMDVHGQLSNMRCILNERAGTFHRPSEFWAREAADDLDLKPHRFLLPSSLSDEDLEDFFLSCGCRQRQDSAMLNDVLHEIQQKYQESSCSKEDCRKDFKLVVKILETLKKNADVEVGEVLLPVYTTQKNTLILRPARECTVAPDPQTIELLSEEEGLVFVHPDLHKHKDVALALGAIDLRSRTLTGVDNIDLEDKEYGQREALTTRLRNLLQEGYTDGFCVPKELLQNADDAGARVVKLLLDERENPDWRSGLITPELSSLQGPAIWAYNDAMFTDTDFTNICKLGGATKKEDCSKVGRFGLGFNAVYNLTEVPTVYSGTTMAMLDPHETYLEGKRGKKMNFNHLMNKVLLKRMPNQFRPFQGIFGCDVLNSEYKPFQGTLFRFPLRTEAQAERSEICKEAFSKHKQDEFIQSLMSKAGNLMLFLQNVQRLELYRLTKDCKEPSQAIRQMVVERQSDFSIQHPGQNILRHFLSRWKQTGPKDAPSVSQNVVDRVSITVQTPVKEKKKGKYQNQSDEQKCRFHIVWATGVREAWQIVRTQREEGFVPLAAIAVPLDHEYRVLPILQCPEGFYRTGHLFCFLPLAKEASTSCLPVHINAPFALTSDRRRLLTQTEDDITQLLGARWNAALFSDAIPRAYLASLHKLESANPNRPDYYSLWPHRLSMMTEEQNFYRQFTHHFYALLVTEDYEIFPHEDGWVAFSAAWFFDPEFKETDVGKVAFRVLQEFWRETEWKTWGVLVDVPHNIVQNIRDSGQRDALQQREITEVEFFTEVLFPRLSGDEGSALDVHDRNLLVLHALMSDNAQLQDLVKCHPCIPCQPDGSLNLPSRLVNPYGSVAKLFEVDDGRFPQKDNGVDFCSHSALSRLHRLGMVKDRLPWEDLLERANSVKAVFITNRDTAMKRCDALVNYFVYVAGELSGPQKEALSTVKFLPVMPRPKEWPFPWFGEGQDFVEPRNAYGKSLLELVACQAAVIDEKRLELSPTHMHRLETLGVTTSAFKTTALLTEIVTEQLIRISQSASDLSADSRRTLDNTCKKIYKYLNTVCETKGEGRDLREWLCRLETEAVVWTQHGFQRADKTAFYVSHDCTPYLFSLDSSARLVRTFLKELGVKEKFAVEDALCVLESIRLDKTSDLAEKDVKLINNLALLLAEALASERKPSLDDAQTLRVHLPDRHGRLRPVSDLCLDDCDWVTESASMHFLHPMISEHLAVVFGVRTKRQHDEDEFTSEFGQCEPLTRRINRLLEGYTRDCTIFKELLQNADDAGATEVRFVKDFRRHPVERVLNDGWKEIMGPALCVYNDASFSQKDMKGIQALGEGSKEEEFLKTGRYGVGFNAVYNLTDTPCFWTRVDGQGETVCLLDPNRFVVRQGRQPGMRLHITDRFHSDYSDMLRPFILTGQGNTKTQTGTVFRLPLRTSDQAMRSSIQQSRVTETEIEKLLSDFQLDMRECLLFLTNVKKIGVYSVRADGVVEQDYGTHLTADERTVQENMNFSEHVRHEADKLKIKGQGQGLMDFQLREITAHVHLSDTKGLKEDWLVVNRFGLANTGSLPEQLQQSKFVRKHRLLPIGGVAICISDINQDVESSEDVVTGVTESQATATKEALSGSLPAPSRSTAKTSTAPLAHNKTPSMRDDAQGMRPFHAYCMLPLPVITGLPVHVNGRFALDHETRLNIDTRPDSGLAAWNHLLASRVIVPAYISALKEIRSTCFSRELSDVETTESAQVQEQQPCEGASGGGKASGRRRRNRRRKSPKLKKATDTEAEQAKTDVKLRSAHTNRLDSTMRQYSRLFPVQMQNSDAFWQSLVATLYQELAASEADVFPVLRKDLGQLLWVPAVKSHGFAGYFWNLPDDQIILKDILRRLNMNIVEHSSLIYEEFQKSNITCVSLVNKENVIEFLLSCRTDTGNTDACSIKNLPQRVENTPFQTTENVSKVFEFIADHVQTLRGLPLSLRSSGRLHYFHPNSPTICSDFFSLLPGSSDVFLHEDLLSFVRRHTGDDCPHFIKQLDIPAFESMLPDSLSRVTFGSGNICTLREGGETLPNMKWIWNCWRFLHQFGEEAVGVTECLSSWSLIPVHDKGKIKLFPLRERDHVVFIPDTETQIESESSEKLVIMSLRKLPLNLLSTDWVPPQNIATKLVASINNPRALLTALTRTSLEKHSLGLSDAAYLLDFFYRRIDCRLFSTEVRRLPLFENSDGELISVEDGCTVVCLPLGVPTDGLSEWASGCTVTILKDRQRLHELFEQLHFMMPSALEFYTNFLLPRIACLPSAAILRQMKHIKKTFSLQGDDSKPLLQQLRKATFIKRADGKMCAASSFYTPSYVVFQAMLTKNDFPPHPYDGFEWRSFLEKIGLTTTVSPDLFLTFAKQVETRGKSEVTQRLKDQSKILSRCLLETRTLWKDYSFLEKLKSLRFLLPMTLREHDDGILLQKIHQGFPAPSLLSFADGCSTTHAYLVWTSACLLHPNADPLLHKLPEDVCEQIGFSPHPYHETVLKHLQNICRSLSRRTPKGKCLVNELEDTELSVLQKIMEALYTILDGFHEEELRCLKAQPVIFHRTEKAMFNADQVVVNIYGNQQVSGHLVKAPEELGKFFPLFRRLGTCEEPVADHYAKTLEKLHHISEGKDLDPNELALVGSCVDNLFNLLKAKSGENSSLSVNTLFLPAYFIGIESDERDRFRRVRLMDSRKLILEVTDFQTRRIKTVIDDLAVFVGFEALKLPGRDLYLETNCLLSDVYRMKLWNDVVKDTVSDSCRTLAFEDDDTRILQERLREPVFVRAVLRLINHKRRIKGTPFPDEDRKDTEKRLLAISILKATELVTILTKDGVVLPKTERRTDFKLEQGTVEDAGQEQRKVKTTLLVSADQDFNAECKNRKLTRWLHKTVTMAVGEDPGELLDQCIEDPHGAQDLLDQEEIHPLHWKSVEVFPSPGTLFPKNMYFLLDNGFYDFKVGDLIESEERPHEDARTKQMSRRYKIDIGKGRFKQVGACELYKIIRRVHHTSLLPSAGDSTRSQSEPMIDNDDDLEAVVDDLRKQLRDVWQDTLGFPSVRDRKRVVKRLILKWHPDKNHGREEFCTKVFQSIQQIVADLDWDIGGFGRAEGNGRQYEDFFDRMYKRGRSYADCSKAYSQSARPTPPWESRFDYYPSAHFDAFSSWAANRQPGEGRRWMRQAVQDLRAAQFLLAGGDAGMYSWVCYLAHQAAEKVLTGLLYTRDANQLKVTHNADILHLARLSSDARLQNLAHSLNEAVGSSKRMRYPDLRDFPRIPSEMYGENEANLACCLAQLIIDRAEQLGNPTPSPSSGSTRFKFHPRESPETKPSTDQASPDSSLRAQGVETADDAGEKVRAETTETSDPDPSSDAALRGSLRRESDTGVDIMPNEGTDESEECVAQAESAPSSLSTPSPRSISLELTIPLSDPDTETEYESDDTDFTPAGNETSDRLLSLDKDMGVLDENLLTSYTAASATQTEADHGQDAPLPICSPHWQASACFSSTGGSLRSRGSDVIMHVPPDAVERDEYVTVRVAVCANVDHVYRVLELSEEEYIASPLVEYWAGHDFRFKRPVRIHLPHALPPNPPLHLVRVYRVTRRHDGHLVVTRLRPGEKPVNTDMPRGDDSDANQNEGPHDHADEGHEQPGAAASMPSARGSDSAWSTTGTLIPLDSDDTASFQLSSDGQLYVTTEHFSGYVCTYCRLQQRPPTLTIIASGERKRSQPGRQTARVKVHIGDKSLFISDFRKEHGIGDVIGRDTLDLLAELDGSKIYMRLEIAENESVHWKHTLRGSGCPMHAIVQCRPVDSVVTCDNSGCRRSGRSPSPLGFTWSLETVPTADLTLTSVLRCVVDICHTLRGASPSWGFCDNDQTNQTTIDVELSDTDPTSREQMQQRLMELDAAQLAIVVEEISQNQIQRRGLLDDQYKREMTQICMDCDDPAKVLAAVVGVLRSETRSQGCETSNPQQNTRGGTHPCSAHAHTHATPTSMNDQTARNVNTHLTYQNDLFLSNWPTLESHRSGAQSRDSRHQRSGDHRRPGRISPPFASPRSDTDRKTVWTNSAVAESPVQARPPVSFEQNLLVANASCSDASSSRTLQGVTVQDDRQAWFDAQPTEAAMQAQGANILEEQKNNHRAAPTETPIGGAGREQARHAQRVEHEPGQMAFAELSHDVREEVSLLEVVNLSSEDSSDDTS